MTSDQQAVDKDTIEFVRLGQRVSLQFIVPLRNRATFDAVMKITHGGNYFDPHEIAATIGPVFDNAANVEFGLELSAVLYMTVPFYPGQRYGDTSRDTGQKYTDADRQAYTRDVIEWASAMRASEITVQQFPPTLQAIDNEPGEHPYRIRLWWD